LTLKIVICQLKNQKREAFPLYTKEADTNCAHFATRDTSMVAVNI
jgi:hypothetical protein